MTTRCAFALFFLNRIGENILQKYFGYTDEEIHDKVDIRLPPELFTFGVLNATKHRSCVFGV